MANGKFVTYYRVSTVKQGKSGLGLEAQQESVTAYLISTTGKAISEFKEVETGKGSNALEDAPFFATRWLLVKSTERHC